MLNSFLDRIFVAFSTEKEKLPSKVEQHEYKNKKRERR